MSTDWTPDALDAAAEALIPGKKDLRPWAYLGQIERDRLRQEARAVLAAADAMPMADAVAIEAEWRVAALVSAENEVALRDELAEARAKVERLTKDRDDAWRGQLAVIAERDDAREALAAVAALADEVWRDSQRGNTIIEHAGIMQDIARRLRAVLADLSTPSPKPAPTLGGALAASGEASEACPNCVTGHVCGGVGGRCKACGGTGRLQSALLTGERP